MTVTVTVIESCILQEASNYDQIQSVIVIVIVMFPIWACFPSIAGTSSWWSTRWLWSWWTRWRAFTQNNSLELQSRRVSSSVFPGCIVSPDCWLMATKLPHLGEIRIPPYRVYRRMFAFIFSFALSTTKAICMFLSCDDHQFGINGYDYDQYMFNHELSTNQP